MALRMKCYIVKPILNLYGTVLVPCVTILVHDSNAFMLYVSDIETHLQSKYSEGLSITQIRDY